MFAKDYRKAAWAKLSNNWTTIVVAHLIYGALVGVASSTGVGSIAVLIFDGVLLVGLSSMLLDISRIGQSKIENVFDGFRYGLASNIVAGLLVNIFTFLWTLLFIIPGIVKSYSYAMAPYIKYDHPEYGWKRCLDESKAMMKGYKWKLFCLDLSFIGWNIVGMLCFMVGIYWVTPYSHAAHVAFYDELKKVNG